jgi:hypothetical protein
VTPISLVFVNGRIRTGDVRRPVADAIAVSGKILALVGSAAEVRKLAGAGVRVVDLRGASVECLQDGDVLRRGAPATFIVFAAADPETEVLRMLDGVIVPAKSS